MAPTRTQFSADGGRDFDARNLSILTQIDPTEHVILPVVRIRANADWQMRLLVEEDPIPVRRSIARDEDLHKIHVLSANFAFGGAQDLRLEPFRLQKEMQLRKKQSGA